MARRGFVNPQALLIGLVVGFGGNLNSRADLIVNGGFEEPLVTSDSGVERVFAPDDTTIPGWHVIDGTVDMVRGNETNGFVSFEGDQHLDLDGVSAGTIEQTFLTSPGQVYWLTFAYTNNPDGGEDAVATANVSVFSEAGTVFSEDISASGATHNSFENMAWSLFSASFVANATSLTLRFASTMPEDSRYGVFLDSVRVVPEPGAWLLTALGLVGLLGLSRRCLHPRP